jgi:hypothetical protein
MVNTFSSIVEYRDVYDFVYNTRCGANGNCGGACVRACVRACARARVKRDRVFLSVRTSQSR